MAKTKKKQHRKDLATPVALDGEEFPSEIVVELWHKPDKGKRALVGSRRYALAQDLPESASAPEAPHDEATAAGDGEVPPEPKAARPTPARKRRPPRRATKAKAQA